MKDQTIKKFDIELTEEQSKEVLKQWLEHSEAGGAMLAQPYPSGTQDNPFMPILRFAILPQACADCVAAALDHENSH